MLKITSGVVYLLLKNVTLIFIYPKTGTNFHKMTTRLFKTHYLKLLCQQEKYKIQIAKFL